MHFLTSPWKPPHLSALYSSSPLWIPCSHLPSQESCVTKGWISLISSFPSSCRYDEREIRHSLDSLIKLQALHQGSKIRSLIVLTYCCLCQQHLEKRRNTGILREWFTLLRCESLSWGVSLFSVTVAGAQITTVPASVSLTAIRWDPSEPECQISKTACQK